MYISNDDTICAPATIPGTGAISVIRVSGSKALEIADKVVSCRNTISSAPGYTIRFGTVFEEDGSILDDVLVSVFHAPHSYTGEDSVEISCHASRYVVEQIMLLLIKAGARAAEPGEFTRRAFLNGKMDLAQAEAVADLIASQSAGAHRIAINQMKGGFSNELKEMRAQLLDIVSLMELELDFSEEEVEFADRKQLNDLLDKVSAHISRLVDSFRLGNAIKNGVPVAIAGATNTGKSTLLNDLLGEERAIVSDIHGTTRDTVEETINLDGITFRFIDTAGIRKTTETVEKIGIERTYRKIAEAEIILGMIDISRPETQVRESLEELLAKVDTKRQNLIILMNKCDILSAEDIQNKKVTIYNIIVSFIDNQYKNPEIEFEIKTEASEQAKTINTVSQADSPAPLTAIRTNDDEFFPTSLMAIRTHGNKTSPVFLLPISAKHHQGIDSLKNILVSIQKQKVSDSGSTLVTNIRHIEALTHALDALRRVKTGLSDSIPTDLVSQDIREALYHIGTIVGEISTDEVLGNIFSRFCIGK